jgi:hypothetical protein
MHENLTTIEKLQPVMQVSGEVEERKNYNPTTPATATMGSACQQALELLSRCKLAFYVQSEELSGGCKWCDAQAHS